MLLFADWDGNPPEDWTSPQGPWTVLEEVGGQGGVTGTDKRTLAGKYRFLISSPVKQKKLSELYSSLWMLNTMTMR